MLSVGRSNVFKYDMKEVLSDSKMDQDNVTSFIAHVTAKAARISTKDAKNYIKEVEERGAFSKGVSEDMCRLLDKYSKYR